ncbi:MAG TPA: flagellar biosynthesis protein FlhB [Xanthobacteraceae bacterium]|nr:flagellar biosynthesis protein FlhB [Xanthobacteraceae bacterium]
MAENDDTDKTEDPTHKKLEEAAREGDIAKSQEVNTWFMLAGGTLAIAVFGGHSASKLAILLRDLLGHIGQLSGNGFSYLQFFAHLFSQIFIAISPLLGILIVAALAGNYVQHGPLWTVKALAFKPSRLSPLSGAKRIFSKQGLVQLAKSMAKFAVVGSVIFLVIYPEFPRIKLLASSDFAHMMPVLFALALRILLGVCAVMGVIAAADWWWTRHIWYERQRMTLREIREEHKQSEGDPTVKAKLRQVRHTRLRTNMLKNIERATVVVTNPTHFAVALQYEPGMNAPVCVGKGMDLIALKIREIAEDRRIPVVENPPLARALHKTVDIDQEVPPEHYKAVAEVIGYVMRLRRTVRH